MNSLFYGQPGTGKSTLATGVAIKYASEGRRVAANYYIDFSAACNSPKSKIASSSAVIIPSRPSFQILESLGLGWHDGAKKLEDKNGLLIIDEAGGWLNSRSWQAQDRLKIIDWLLQARKRGWDVLLIAKHPSILDKQVREAVVEGYARVRRMDRLKLFSFIPLPRIHIAILRYGLELTAPVLERFIFRGQIEQQCFHSYDLFGTDSESAIYSVLPARITKFHGAKNKSQIKSAIRYAQRPLKKPKNHIIRLIERLPESIRTKHAQHYIRFLDTHPDRPA